MVTGPTDPRLDLDTGIGQRSASWRFALSDAVTGMPLGELQPARDPAPTLTHDTSRAIKRTLTLTLEPADTARIDPLHQRLTVTMLVAGRTWPLGRYMWTSDERVTGTTGRFAGGDRSSHQLVDEMFVADQQLDRGFAAVGSVDATVIALLSGLPIPGVQIDPTPYPALGGWPAGTRRGQILDALATQGDYQTPWMDHAGTFRMIRTVDPATAIPALDLDAGNRVIRDSITASSDILDAPNRFVVTSTDTAALPGAIVGTFDIPPTAPHSIAQRGFVIASVTSLQVANQGQADAAARNLGLRATIIDRAALGTVPDPRHDSYDVIRWRGVNWLEVGWSMQLAEGAEMRHVLVRRFG